MRRYDSRSEKKVFSAIKTLVTLTGIIFTILYSCFLLYKQTNPEASVYWFIVGALLYTLIQYLLFQIKGGVFLKWLFSTIFKSRKDSLVGSWSIVIDYVEEETFVSRHGTLVIKESILGLRIDGDSLFDTSTGEIEVGRWESNYANVMTLDNKEVLTYQYLIYEKNSKDDLDKVGHVYVSKRINELKTEYVGRFSDFMADRVIRQGNVRIYKTDKQKS